MSVRLNDYITDTNENSMLPPQLVNTVSDTLDVLDFIKDRPENVFYKHLEHNLVTSKYVSVLPKMEGTFP